MLLLLLAVRQTYHNNEMFSNYSSYFIGSVLLQTSVELKAHAGPPVLSNT